jgi:hypothetical protein
VGVWGLGPQYDERDPGPRSPRTHVRHRVGLTLQHTNRETLVKDQQDHAAEVTSSHRGVCGARSRKMMTDDVVRAFRGHTSAEDVGPVGVEPTLART